MARTFSLSANIENGFAEGMQYLVTPNAQNAIHNIVNDFRTGIHSFTIIGSYGTGKSSFLLALEADLKKTGKQKYLLDSKNLSDAKSFEIMNIVGDYAEMSTLLSKALNVEGNTTSILDSLKNYYTQCQKKGKFLLIVVDEFGKVLEHAAKNNPEKEEEGGGRMAHQQFHQVQLFPEIIGGRRETGLDAGNGRFEGIGLCDGKGIHGSATWLTG